MLQRRSLLRLSSSNANVVYVVILQRVHKIQHGAGDDVEQEIAEGRRKIQLVEKTNQEDATIREWPAVRPPGARRRKKSTISGFRLFRSETA